ncbi:type II secretion system F family protein [Photobacterium leiognathi]|uniref:type II secretion system F family protein n=1 Tax=Photobacterium leiognathi TaxID=553611 RepID=UPI00298217B9|nr:type II secretion system F family protein [Photobacterium leiognathi]
MPKKFSNEWFAQLTFKRKIQIEFVSDMAVSLRCNLSAKEHLEQVVKFGSKKQAIPARYMLAKMKASKPLSVAMEGWFPPVVIQAVRAGESNRKLDEALDNAVDALNNGGIIGKVLGSNAYSLFLISLGTIANVVAFLFIFEPKLDEVSLRFWSPVSKVAYNVGYMFVYQSLYYVIGFGIFFFLWGKFLGRKTNKFRAKFDNLPIFKEYRVFNATTLLSSLSLMFKSNIAPNKSLPLIEKCTDGYLQSHVKLMIERLGSAKNNSIGSVLGTGLLTDGELARIEVLTSKNSRSVGFVLDMSKQQHQKMLDAAITRYGVILQAFSMIYTAGMILVTFIGVSALNMIGL